MKTERRHELHTNYLADWMGKQFEAVRPYSKLILGVIIGVLAIWIGISVMSERKSAQIGGGWNSYFTAFNDREPVAALGDVAKRYDGTKVGLWAMQSAADTLLSEGIQELYSDRAAGEAKLKRAKENYRIVEQQARDEPMLRRRALFGSAQAYESLGDLKSARALYEQLSKDASETAIGKAAARRLNNLVDPATDQLRPEIIKFYDEFASYKPAPPAITPRGVTPQAGGAKSPLDFGDLPDGPDFSFPLGNNTSAIPTAPPGDRQPPTSLPDIVSPIQPATGDDPTGDDASNSEPPTEAKDAD